MRILRTKYRRTAAHAVEFAFVIPVVLLLLFGILEYCRYLMTLQVTDNAAREAARHALARTDTFQTGESTTSITNFAKDYAKSCGMQLTGTAVKVYKSNKYGEPLDTNGVVQSSYTTAAAFDQTTFGDYITVQITGTYEPVLPSFMWLAPAITVTATATMCSEGN